MAAWKPVRSYVDGLKAYQSAREEIVRVEGEIDERVKGLYGAWE